MPSLLGEIRCRTPLHLPGSLVEETCGGRASSHGARCQCVCRSGGHKSIESRPAGLLELVPATRKHRKTSESFAACPISVPIVSKPTEAVDVARYEGHENTEGKVLQLLHVT